MPRKRYTYAEFTADMALFDLSAVTDTTFSLAVLKSRYNSRIKRVHPDKPGGSTAKTAELNAANDRLKDWIGRGRPAWPEQQTSEEPKPDPAAAAARAAKAAAAERAEAERQRAAREAAEAVKAAAARRRQAEQAQAAEAARAAAEAAKSAEARRREAEEAQAAEAARAAAEAEALREQVEAAARGAEAERRRLARRRGLLLMPLRAGRGLAGRLPLSRLAAIAAGVGMIYAWPAIEASQLAATVPAMPSLGLPLKLAWLPSFSSGGANWNHAPYLDHPSTRARRCSQITRQCWYVD